ncbi:type IV toxin-antitoxin system AbiEi family antitoxin [Catenuloplanes sp. NPDC051500]|uniref:type IV toxin-antitoxin system AbiEi family antitoxin n=1 Tax=Catenuloplanes sp. NPDC051500 TaxID=3363959 RepID=UPI0037AB413C
MTRRQLQSSAWRGLFRDVYIAADDFVPADHRMWCVAAALLLPPGAAISGASAAYLWGAGVPDRQAPVTVTVPKGRRLEARPGLHVMIGRLREQDVAQCGGLPVTSPERTAFDLGRQPDRQRAIIALDAMLHRGVVSLDRLEAFARGRASWPGVNLFTSRLAEAERLAESPMETLTRLLITDAGLPRPVAQFDIMARGRWLARVDLAYPALHIALEYEGDHHRDRTTFRRDIPRLRRIEQAGWLILRLTADDILRTPAETLRLITATRLHREDAAHPAPL